MSRFQDMQIFAEVVRRSNFSATAEYLDLSKQYVSRRISVLEERLGVRLLNRTTRRLSPTALGLEYYERILHIMEEVKEIEQSIISYSNQPRGRLHITAPLSHALHAPASSIASAFIKDYPDVKIDIDFSDRIIDLIKEGFDLAIRIGILSDSSLIAQRISSFRYLTVASPEYLKKRGEPLEPIALHEHDCLLYGHSKATPWHYLIENHSQELNVCGRLRANNGDFLCKAAIANGGITQLPDFIVNSAIKQNLLCPILQDFEPRSLGIFAVYPRHRQVNVLTQAFIKFLQKSLNEEPYQISI